MMTLDELVRNVQKIEVLKNSVPHKKFSGLYDSPFRGSGLTTDYIRKYEIGDDVRDINWNVTARFREPYVNTFTEDKERLIWILVDISSSMHFGVGKTKLDIAIEIAATLAYSALKRNDAVGTILFSDKIERLIKPDKGMANFWRIAKALVDIKPMNKTTGLQGALQFASRLNNRKSLMFVVSDFVTDDKYGSLCKTLAQKNELNAIRIYDKLEANFPAIGWIKMRDGETGREQWVNTTSRRHMDGFSRFFSNVEHCFNQAFAGTNVRSLTIATDDNYIHKLFNFMSSR